jgi:chromosome segregation ATPase
MMKLSDLLAKAEIDIEAAHHDKAELEEDYNGLLGKLHDFETT